MEAWLEKNLVSMIQGKFLQSFCGRGYFYFLFEKKKDRDLFFRNGLYFGAFGCVFESMNG